MTILFEHQAMVKPFSSRTTPNEVFSSSGLSGVIRGQSGFGVIGDLPVRIIKIIRTPNNDVLFSIFLLLFSVKFTTLLGHKYVYKCLSHVLIL